MYQEVFKRCEKKYILTADVGRKLIEQMKDYIEPDKYAEYTIRNIYFDTKNYSLIRNSIEKPVYKEKLRLRSYNVPGKSDKVFVELKKKFDGIVYKRRINLNYEDAVQYLYQGHPPEKVGQVIRELNWFLKCHEVHPVVYLAYDRTAFHGIEDGNLRITFDKSIRCRQDNLMLDKEDECENILEPDKWVMEIKVNDAIPLWLAGLLSEYKIYPTSFSKYGTYYKKRIMNNR